MKYTLAIILIFLGISSVFSQDLSINEKNKDSLLLSLDDVFALDTITISFTYPKSPFDIPNAIKDIENDSMSIVLNGSLTGFGNIDKTRKKAFQKKYNIQFHYLGCLRTWNTDNEDTHGYNETIFDHLIKVHGDIVKKEFKAIWN